MVQKFFHWVKFHAERHPFWVSAAVVALLVHLLLLGLFRYAPQPRRVDAGALAPMMVIDLGKKENAELLRWVEFHAPELMTAADSPYGYSRILRDAPFRPAAEDLPRPPQLARPVSGPPPRLPESVWSAPPSFPVLASSVPAKVRRAAAERLPVQVFFNGQEEPDLSRRLSAKYQSMAGTLRPKQATEIAALPMAGRFRLETSSGDAVLDRMALYELKLWSDRRQTDAADGVFSIMWQPRKEVEQ